MKIKKAEETETRHVVSERPFENQRRERRYSANCQEGWTAEGMKKRIKGSCQFSFIGPIHKKQRKTSKFNVEHCKQGSSGSNIRLKWGRVFLTKAFLGLVVVRISSSSTPSRCHRHVGRKRPRKKRRQKKAEDNERPPHRNGEREGKKKRKVSQMLASCLGAAALWKEKIPASFEFSIIS
jgi:hypothetical protein